MTRSASVMTGLPVWNVTPGKRFRKAGNLFPVLAKTRTSAPIPCATASAFEPTLPAPTITTLPAATPSSPGSRTPLPPFCFCRHHAPACTASRPAMADIGARIGRLPPDWPTVSKAMKVAPEARAAPVLRFLELLHLDHKLAFPRSAQFRAPSDVILVREAGRFARAGFDDD